MDARYLIDANGEVADDILETIKYRAPYLEKNVYYLTLNKDQISFKPLFEKGNEVETEVTPQLKQEVSEPPLAERGSASAQAPQP
jgi:hypothetical protein